MKKVKINSILFLSIFISVIGFNELKAQDSSLGKNELRLSISDAIPLKLVHDFSGILISSLDNKGYDSKISTFGMLHLNYQRYLSDRIKIGGGISYVKFEDSDNKNKLNAGHLHYLAVMPQFEYVFVKNDFLELYSNASAGITSLHYKINKNTNSEYGFAFQVNPVGLRIGKKIGGFVEAGYGYNGFVNIGIDFRF
ncbi:hypothetical protein ATE84_2319 [Aquimarina sp. MAR_2010_214]|uniref:hypothetical protein n=1 Tax=Aquimarina sp. MAR_2010_214 TaxID=1250026 RepID=UPI000C707253|nr:hypothetical protein [Aquimarina sp. MAR_2010_214]PKV50264.1 hypothetical protein ATE84_2319 [Aquimarina sp. MAR_2010_214]